MKRFSIASLLGLLLISCSSDKSSEVMVELTPIMEKALNDTSSIFYADFKNFPANRASLPIGVFDSGTGGLTVLEELLTIDCYNNITGEEQPDGMADFIGEEFQYLADNANMPYGNYAAENKDMFFRELVTKDALFLLGNKYATNFMDKSMIGRKSQCKILVIACNTATAYGLGDVQTLLEQSGTGVKVIGVINAGADAMLSSLGDSSDSVAVGVLATPGTIKSGAYPRTIMEMAAARGFKGGINVVCQPCAGFAESVDMEKDFVDPTARGPRSSYRGPVAGDSFDNIIPTLLPLYHFASSKGELLGRGVQMQLNASCNYARLHLVNLIEKYRRMGGKAPMKSIILGCTHYPFLLDTMRRAVEQIREYKENGVAIYEHLLPADVNFINPATYTAMEAYRILREDKALALSTGDTKATAYISIPAYGLSLGQIDSTGVLTYEFKYGREYGKEDNTTLNVPFAPKYITPQNNERLADLVPVSYKLICTEAQ